MSKYDTKELLKRINELEKENRELKAFIKEACEVIRLYRKGYQWEGGRRAIQLMNTDKYRDYS